MGYLERWGYRAVAVTESQISSGCVQVGCEVFDRAKLVRLFDILGHASPLIDTSPVPGVLYSLVWLIAQYFSCIKA